MSINAFKNITLSYSRGKIRSLSSLGSPRSLEFLRKPIKQPQNSGICYETTGIRRERNLSYNKIHARYQSSIHTCHESQRELAVDDGIINQIISIISSPQYQNDERDRFLSGNFEKFKELNTTTLVNQKLLKSKTEYTTIVELNELIQQNRVKDIVSLVISRYNHGIFLSLLEFQSLFIQLLPYNWYAYKILSLYKERYEFTVLNDQLLELILKVSYSNFDFKLFDKIFKIYELKNDKFSPEILMLAIQVYLKTENIHIATQLFNQQVMMENELPNRILDLFVSNLYNQTKNISLCLSSYRLWISKRNFKTNLSIDSFMYNLVLESKNEEDIGWIEKSLVDRNLFDKFTIQFGNLCNELSKDEKKYLAFINSDIEFNRYLNLSIEHGESSSFWNNITYLHLRHKKYEMALESFKNINNRKDFHITIFSILRHFEKDQKPEMIFKFLKCLREDCNLVIHWSQILIYWRALIKKYPDLGYKIDLKFKRNLKKSKYHKFSFLNKLLFCNKQPGNSKVSRYYPIIKYNNLQNDYKPLTSLPELNNIESRLRSRILPNNELLRKAIKLTRNENDFNRLVEISNNLNDKNNSKFNNIKLNIEIFFKDKYFNHKTVTNKEFFDRQLEIVNNNLQYIDYNDLLSLFRLCVKLDLPKESLICIELFQRMNIRIENEQESLKFLSLFLRLCWNSNDFKKIILLLEWLKNQNVILVDSFFIENLILTGNKMIKHLKNKYSDKASIFNDESANNEREYINNLLPLIVEFYSNVISELRAKMQKGNKEVIDECNSNFKELIKWVDEDTETKL